MPFNLSWVCAPSRGSHFLAASPPWVRSTTAFSSKSTSRFPVSGSTSTKTGMAFSKSKTLVEATKENGVVITRSPASIPAALTHRCSPAVPEFTATACLAPTKSAMAFSKLLVCFPMLKIGELTTSITMARSASVRSGLDMGTRNGNFSVIT